MVRCRGESARLPMAAILPPRIPRSPEYQGDPVPSTMWPLVMIRSKGCPCWFCAMHKDAASSRIMTRADIEVGQFPITLILSLFSRSKVLTEFESLGYLLGPP